MITQEIEFVNEKIDEFSLHKKFALDFQRKLAQLYNSQKILLKENEVCSKSQRVLDCGNRLIFERYNDKDETTRLYGANFCKNKLCPMCAWRLHLKNAVRFQKVFKSIGKHNFYHLVLTIRNIPNITKDFVLKLREKATQFMKKSLKIKDYFLSFELTIDKNGYYHPHYHIVYINDSDKRFTKKYLQTEWAYICNYGDKYQVVNNAKCNGDTISRELTKYILKFEDIQPNIKQLKTIDTALKGIRKYSSNGIFLQMQREVDKTIELEDFEKMCNLENYESEILFYKWFGEAYELTEVRENERQESIN